MQSTVLIYRNLQPRVAYPNTQRSLEQKSQLNTTQVHSASQKPQRLSLKVQSTQGKTYKI
jgi:hypothetical protein